MTQRLIRLIYLSTATPAFRLDAGSLDNILLTSRRRNSEGGLTGLLCIGGAHFLQVLEGPEKAVIQTYARILDDERHTDCTLLSFTPISARLFPRWSMASLDHPETVHACGFDDIIAARSQPDPNDPTLPILRRFVERVQASQADLTESHS